MDIASLLDIGVWLTACGVAATAGAFLDRYHTTNKAREVARSVAVKMFIYLDRPWLVYPRQSIYGAISKKIRERNFLFLILLVIASYIVVVSVFWFGRITVGVGATISYVEYLATWLVDDHVIFWLAIVTLGYISVLTTVFVVDMILLRWSNSSSNTERIIWSFLATTISSALLFMWAILFLLLGVISTHFILTNITLSFSDFFDLVGFILQGTSLAFFDFSDLIALSGGPSGGLLLEPLFTSALVVLLNITTIIMNLLALFITMVKIILDALIFVVKEMLSAASSPENSPFTYASALVSLLVAIGKLVHELVV